MKPLNTCSSIGCNSYKFVPTIYVIVASAMIKSNSTTSDPSIINPHWSYFIGHWTSPSSCSYFNTTIIENSYTYLKASPRGLFGRQYSINAPKYCIFTNMNLLVKILHRIHTQKLTPTNSECLVRQKECKFQPNPKLKS